MRAPVVGAGGGGAGGGSGSSFGNDLTLEVYPDQYQWATGKLYMDDGQTFAHEKDCEKTLVFFGFLDNILYIQREIEDECRFDGAEK